ncbi:MAG: c-type cytochrome [Comamonadaceae bacterium]|jgi:cytochrome c
MKHNTHIALGLLGATLLVAAISACAPVTRTASGQICNAEAAKGLAMKDHCLACHSLTKQKSGPTFKAVAKRYQGKPNAEAELFAHLTSSDVSKMSDGDTGFHKCIGSEDPERIRNMVRWILDQ